MTIKIEWDNDEKTIALLQFEGEWSWNDFLAVQAELHDMLRTIDHMADVIADMRQSPSLPRNILSAFRGAEKNAVPNRGYIVLVGANAFIRGMAGAYNRVFKHKSEALFLIAETADDARALLAERQQLRS